MSGAVRVMDAPGGAVYLVDGLIAYAECSMLPGVDRLLIASGRVPGDAWRAAVVAAVSYTHLTLPTIYSV